MAHAKPPGPKDKEERPKVGNNNGQLHIFMPPRVAYAKPPGPKYVHNLCKAAIGLYSSGYIFF